MSAETASQGRPAVRPLLRADDQRHAAPRRHDTSGDAIVDAARSSRATQVAGRGIVRTSPARSGTSSWRRIGGVDVVITTGGTGITSRDSTYEAIAALLEQAAGRLRRAVPDAQLLTRSAAAAMLSRACAGTIGRTAVFSLPGSEHAVRLAMTKLILPEIGHVVRELRRRRRPCTMRPIRDTIPLDEALRPAPRGGAADRRGPSGSRSARRSGRVVAAAAVVGDRRAAVRSRRDGRLRRHRRGHVRRRAATTRRRCAASRRSTPARSRRAACRARRVHRDRDRRADARRRRRRRDGRGDREGRTPTRCAS